MKITPVAPPVLAPTPPVTNDAGQTNDQPSPAAVANSKAAERAAVSFSPPLSAETHFHASALGQEDAPQHPHGHVPPAQAARAAIEEHPELADLPFGAIVSRIARGLPLPINVEAVPEEDPAAVSDPELPEGGDPVPPEGEADVTNVPADELSALEIPVVAPVIVELLPEEDAIVELLELTEQAAESEVG